MSTLGTAQVIRANARDLPLADNSVDLVVTSPPYFALRSYQDGGEHYAGQIGEEPTPAEFVASLLEVTRECVRVLKPSGSLWVNLGDKYAQAEERSRNGNGNRQAIDNFSSGSVLREPTVTLGRKSNGVPRKSLIGIPWRYALACIDDLGLILRAEVIWSKPNGLPESVTDRVRRSHEVWFHFTLEPRYFSAVDEIREAHKPGQSPSALSFNRDGRETAPGQTMAPHRIGREDQGLNPLGKLPGSVWTIPTEPLRVPDHLGIDHFAAFPTEWPRRIIQGWSPVGVCVECGEGRRPVTRSEYVPLQTTNGDADKWRKDHARDRQVKERGDFGRARSESTITGYVCACTPKRHTHLTREGEVSCFERTCGLPDILPPTRPAIVLDPFGGTGTTALVAKALGRHGITVDMSADYCRLAEWRTNDRNQLAKVLGIEKAPTVDVEQLDLFGEATA